MEIAYTVQRSGRRTLAIRITPQGQVEVRCPYSVSERRIREFVAQKAGWIQKHLPSPGSALPALTAEQLRQLKVRASQRLADRAAYYAPRIGVGYGRITVRCQKTRWGSCSGKGNLNFNCLLMLAPPEVQDYVVIHELCHRRHMNHSGEFWSLVARFCPDYLACRKWLRENGGKLLGRIE